MDGGGRDLCKHAHQLDAKGLLEALKKLVVLFVARNQRLLLLPGWGGVGVVEARLGWAPFCRRATTNPDPGANLDEQTSSLRSFIHANASTTTESL